MSDLPLFGIDASDSEKEQQQETRTLPHRRKPQSEQEFQQQLKQYTAPLIQTETWLFEKDYKKDCDPSSKFDRNVLKNAIERAYYLRNYAKVVELVDITRGESWNELGSKERVEFDKFEQAALAKLPKINAGISSLQYD